MTPTTVSEPYKDPRNRLYPIVVTVRAGDMVNHHRFAWQQDADDFRAAFLRDLADPAPRG